MGAAIAIIAIVISVWVVWADIAWERRIDKEEREIRCAYGKAFCAWLENQNEPWDSKREMANIRSTLGDDR